MTHALRGNCLLTQPRTSRAGFGSCWYKYTTCQFFLQTAQQHYSHAKHTMYTRTHSNITNVGKLQSIFASFSASVAFYSTKGGKSVFNKPIARIVLAAKTCYLCIAHIYTTKSVLGWGYWSVGRIYLHLLRICSHQKLSKFTLSPNYVRFLLGYLYASTC